MSIIYLSSGQTRASIATKYARALTDGGADLRIFHTENHLYPEEYWTGAVPSSSPVHLFYLGRRYRIHPDYYRRRFQLARARTIIADDPMLLDLAVRYARKSGARVVYMPFEYYPGLSHGTPEERAAYLEIERRCAPAVDVWIAFGEKIVDVYESNGVPRDRIKVVYCSWPGVPTTSKPALRRAIGAPEGAKVVLYHGGITRNRGIWDVLAALPMLPADVHFAILGGGESDQLRADIAASGLGDRAHVVDTVPQAEMMDYVLDADIGVIPVHNMCVSYDYCCPGKLFDCVAAGLPLAVSRLKQLDWFVTSKELGEVFEPGSPESIARAIARLSTDDAHRRQCAENCRRLHEREARWEIQAEKLRRAVLGVVPMIPDPGSRPTSRTKEMSHDPK